MTPEERQQGERDFLTEYQEVLACLAILDQRLRDGGERLAQLARQVDRGEMMGNTDGLADELAAFAETLTDYRRSRGRAQSLYDALRNTLSAVIKDVPYPLR